MKVMKGAGNNWKDIRCSGTGTVLWWVCKPIAFPINRPADVTGLGLRAKWNAHSNSVEREVPTKGSKTSVPEVCQDQFCALEGESEFLPPPHNAKKPSEPSHQVGGIVSQWCFLLQKRSQTAGFKLSLFWSITFNLENPKVFVNRENEAGYHLDMGSKY